MDAQLEQLERHFGRPLDPIEKLVAQSLFLVVIYTNLAGDDLELIDPDAVPVPALVLEDYERRGLGFAGLVGVSRTFVPRTELVIPLEDHTLQAITAAFAQLMDRVFARAEESWLERMFRLPDTRLPN